MNRLRVNVAPNGAADDGPSECPFVVKLELDGAPFGLDYVADLGEIIRAAFSDAEAHPLTCTCGVPECAGIWEPVRARCSGDVVTWAVTEPEPPQDLTFDAAQLQAEVLAAFREAERLTADAPEHAEAFPGWNARRYLEWARDMLHEAGAV